MPIEHERLASAALSVAIELALLHRDVPVDLELTALCALSKIYLYRKVIFSHVSLGRGIGHDIAIDPSYAVFCSLYDAVSTEL